MNIYLPCNEVFKKKNHLFSSRKLIMKFIHITIKFFNHETSLFNFCELITTLLQADISKIIWNQPPSIDDVYMRDYKGLPVLSIFYRCFSMKKRPREKKNRHVIVIFLTQAQQPHTRSLTILLYASLRVPQIVAQSLPAYQTSLHPRYRSLIELGIIVID